MSNFAKIIAFDLETTGLDDNKHEIIEIGGVKFSVKESRGRIVPDKIEEFQSFIKASKSNEAVNVNHITDDMLVSAPSISEVLQKFKTFCDDANCLVAHNAPFDTKFLSTAYGKHSIPAPQLPILDSIKIARNTIQLPDYKLGNITKALESRSEINFKIKDESMHRAVYDCEMLMHILVALLRNRLSMEDWAGQAFLQVLKKKDIQQDPGQIKPVIPKAKGFF
ncbi:MAG: 3'-5' exonuclease [Fibromonadaceae bacterium]|jgi:DNA polymerase III epsilon subunit family exonuclease|nr:3'-5' exonuclease [Fibromonadaceae bacterium]